MDKKKLLYWVGGFAILLVIWLIYKRQPATQFKENYNGPAYMTYNQPNQNGAMPIAGLRDTPLKFGSSGHSCGCNPAMSNALSKGSDLAASLEKDIASTFGQYRQSLNDFLASQAGY